MEDNVELFTDGKLGDFNVDIVKYVFTVSYSNRIYNYINNNVTSPSVL